MKKEHFHNEKVNKKILILLFLIFQGITALFSQSNYSLSGYVKDSETDKGLEGANVTLMPGNLGTMTDSRGEFSIKSLKKGKYVLSVTFVGYNKFEKEVIIESGSNLILEVILFNTSVKLRPVIIQSDKKDENYVPFVKSKVLKTDIDINAARDIGDFLRSVPNVSGVRKGGVSIDPVVRGFKYDQLNVHLDGGIRVEGGCPNRMDPVASHIDLYDVENIEIIKGPFVLRYGSSLGGIVNLISSRPQPFESKKFGLDIEAIKGFESKWKGDKGHILIHGGNNRIYFNLGGGQMDYGNYKDGNGNLVKSQFNKYNYTVELGSLILPNHELMISYNRSFGRDVYFPALPMDERSDNTAIMSLDYRIRNFDGRLRYLNLKAYNSVVEHEMDNYERPNSDTMAAVTLVDATNKGGRLDATINLNEKSELFLGVDYENIFKDGTRTKNMYTMPPGPNKQVPQKVERLWYNSYINNIGLISDYKYTLSKTDLSIGFRYDNNSSGSDDTFTLIKNGVTYYDNYTSHFSNYSVSVGINKHIKKYLIVGLALGRGNRSPNMIERYIKFLPVGYDKYDYLGNPYLEPESNNQIDLNIRYNNEIWGNILLNGFYAYVTNFISGEVLPSSVVLPQTQGVIGVKQFENLDKVYLRGFELSYNSPSKYKFTYLMNLYYTKGTNPAAIDKNGNEVSDALPEIPPMELNATISYKAFKNTLIPKFTIRYVFTQDYVSKTTYLTATETEPTTPSFYKLDFMFLYKYNKYLTISAGVNNILDEAYYEHLNRRIVGSTTNLYEPGRVYYINMIVKL
jgi:iron complex outermembrane receptor protein